jgi:enoyl-CoA hydratase/carnithine racemase
VTGTGIEIERAGDVWILRMRSGENRFTAESVAALDEALDEADSGQGPSALVTTGDGKFYSNGLDLDWLAGAGRAAGGFLDSVHRLLGRVMAFPAVTVAAVNGHAFAAGAMLAVAHDFVIMREDRGYWCLPEADLGLPLTPQMFAVIAAKLPCRTAQEAIVTGRRYGAREAQAAGIVHRTASEPDVLAAAVGTARELAGKDRRALAEHKRLLYGEAIRVCGARQPGGQWRHGW